MQEIWHGHQKLKDGVLSVHIIRSPLDCAHTPIDNRSAQEASTGDLEAVKAQFEWHYELVICESFRPDTD